MIAYITLSTILLALTWLLRETDYLTVRLPVGAAIVKTETTLAERKLDEYIRLYTNEQPETPKPILLLDTPHYHPSVFITQDMPDVNIGKLEILCVRE
jgi:hypothetical protein